MKRREFITSLAGTVAFPLVARAQQPEGRVRRVGVLLFQPERDSVAQAYVAALRQSLRQLGWSEGRNLRLELRFSNSDAVRIRENARALVDLAPDVLVSGTVPSTRALQDLTRKIPIVFVAGGDPVETGVVDSLNRPSGNTTGVSFSAEPVTSKRLELLHELVPKDSAMGLLWDPTTPLAEPRLKRVQTAAQGLGRQIITAKAGTEAELEAAFISIVQAGAGALFAGPSTFYNSRRRQLVALAAHHRLPASYAQREHVVIGGLMTYSASDTDAYRRAGLYIGRILHGAAPGDLPVDLPTKFELVINLATARALKLDIPPRIFALADEVIE